MRRRLLCGLAAVAALAIGGGAAEAALAAAPVAGDWGANAAAYRGQNGARFDYVCPKPPADIQIGPLWGSGPFTDDSSVCAAATYAGIVTVAAGGLVTVEIRPGEAGYTGGTANGVTARGYPAYSGSYVIVGGRAGGGSPGVAMGQLGWDGTVKSYRGQNGTRLASICPPGGTSNRLWGSDLYTDDSSVCLAGVQSGVISAGAGGTVVAEVRAGAAAYKGATANGVKSNDYGGWGGSFAVVGAKPVAGKPATAAGVVAGGASWTSDTKAYRGKVGTLVRVTCPAGGKPSVVWGSGTYTDDSSVCTAAVHAGLITLARGGTVTVRVTAGLSSYAGTIRNGVTTRPYAKWPGSFAFVR